MNKSLKTFNIICYVFLGILAVSCGSFGGYLITQGNSSIALFGITSVKVIGWVLVASAIFLIVTSFFGCIGTITESKCCMTIFLVIMSIVIIVLLGSGGALFYWNSQVQTMLKDYMKSEFFKKYEVDVQYTLVWEDAQPKYNCCGVDNGADYKSTSWYNRPQHETHREGEVPRTCCTRKDTEYLNVTSCMKSRPEDMGPYIYQNGCWENLRKQIAFVLHWTSIAVFALSGILILILILSCVMNIQISREIIYGQVV